LFVLIVESEDIVDGVVESLLKMYFILLISVLVLAFLSSHYLLKPFRKTLEQIQAFSLQSPGNTIFEKSSVVEFQKLNEFLQSMTEKMKADYRMLKEFSENASHELQTPIAVAHSKLDRLIQNESLSPQNMELLGASYQALNHLKKISNALALISKLDNKEFEEEQKIDLSLLVQEKIKELAELSDIKSIQVTTHLETSVSLSMNKTLLDILLNNLIGNAIKHNIDSGYLKVELTASNLIIQNSGEPLPFPSNEVFDRFKKSNSKSLGLGLSIVKKICDYYGMGVSYQNDHEHHEVSISFQA